MVAARARAGVVRVFEKWDLHARPSARSRGGLLLVYNEGRLKRRAHGAHRRSTRLRPAWVETVNPPRPRTCRDAPRMRRSAARILPRGLANKRWI